MSVKDTTKLGGREKRVSKSFRLKESIIAMVVELSKAEGVSYTKIVERAIVSYCK